MKELTFELYDKRSWWESICQMSFVCVFLVYLIIIKLAGKFGRLRASDSYQRKFNCFSTLNTYISSQSQSALLNLRRETLHLVKSINQHKPLSMQLWYCKSPWIIVNKRKCLQLFQSKWTWDMNARVCRLLTLATMTEVDIQCRLYSAFSEFPEWVIKRWQIAVLKVMH